MDSTTGAVTAVSAGTAVIRATSASNTSISDTCTYTVTSTPIAVTAIALNKSSYTLTMGSAFKLIPTIFPATATNQNVTWSTSNSSVAVVDSNGNVAGLTEGTAVITAASAYDPTKKATCTVSVTPVNVTNLTLNTSAVSLLNKQTYTLVATISPTDATNQNVLWSSNNPSVTVDSTGHITANSVGTATITAKIAINNSSMSTVFKTAYCTVTVLPNPYLVTGVTLTQSGLSSVIGDGTSTASGSLTLNGIATLTATVLPATATNKNVTWTTSNQAIVSFNTAGGTTATITGLSSGTATITATSTDDGTKLATYTITVN